jgi:hypothetical protein
MPLVSVGVALAHGGHLGHEGERIARTASIAPSKMKKLIQGWFPAQINMISS